MNTHNERGIVLVFVALTLCLLLLFVGLVIDAGMMVYVRAQGQARVDAATLAAAAALIHPTGNIRQAEATALAQRFGNLNTIAGAANNPSNMLIPIRYDENTNSITTQTTWEPGHIGEFCNAIQVREIIPTSVFFSGIRALFGGQGNAIIDQQVQAIGYLPCPSLLDTNTAQGIAPIALRSCAWSFPADCDHNRRLYEQSQQVDNVVWTTYNLHNTNKRDCSDIADGSPYPPDLEAEVKVGDVVSTGNGQVTPCLRALRGHYQGCSIARGSQQPPDPACTAVVPVVSCGGAQSEATVVGFATICFTAFDIGNAPKWVDGSLSCGQYASSSGGSGGVCLGTHASTPILVQ